MEFGFSEEQEQWRKAVREFARRECPPEYAQACDREGRPPTAAFRALAKQGWLGVSLPEAAGGSGGDFVELAILLEELGRGCLDLALWVFRSVTYGGHAILRYGTPAQQARFVPAAARGEISVAFALTEPESGSDAASLKTAAAREGDAFVLSGQKMFTSGMDVSDVVLLAARTDPQAPKHGGISCFLVDCKSPGIDVQRLETLGHRAIATTAVFLDGVRVPKDRLLGPLNGGWPVVTTTLELERLCLSAARTGAAAAAFEDALAYAKTRQQFGRPIGKFQAVAHQLADMQVMLDVSRTLVYRFAWLMGTASMDRRDAAVLKLYTAEAYKFIADRGMQILGGYGYTMDSAMQRHFRDSRLATIGGGTSEIQRNIIAHSLGL
ncbi:MAG TPA: acyl-CoA dehydrogenase family protein [Candidatus Methylomirabilis sp.]|jgi:alkylation response protein AidB-like acyl-CoA dehydrogenase